MIKQAFIFYATIILLFASCNNINNNNKGDDNEQHDTLYVRVAVAQDSSFSDTLRMQAELIPYREANLGVAIPGRVERILHPKGSVVKKGTLLVLLSNEMLLQKESEFQAVEKDFNRIKDLYNKGSVSRQEFDHIKAKYDAGKAELEMLKKNTRIVAPFDGIVADIITHEHENYAINPSLLPGYSNTSGIIKFLQTDTLLVRFYLHERYLSVLDHDRQLRTLISSVSKIPLALQVHHIGDFLSSTYQMAEVTLLLPNKHVAYKAGMSAYVLLDLPGKNGVAVPMDAIMRLPGSNQDFVYVLRGKSYEQKHVDAMYTYGNTVFVSGISEQDSVITEGKLNVQKDRLLIVKK